MVSDDRLVETQIEALLRVRADANYWPSTSPAGGRTPCSLGRTRAGNVVRYRHDLPDQIVHESEDIVAWDAPLSGEPPATEDGLLAVLRGHAPNSTSWGNTRSRRLAQQLGLVLYAADVHGT